jgi:type II secretory pathway component PulC
MHPWRATIWAITLVLVAAVGYSAAVTTTLVIEQRLAAPGKERPQRPAGGGRATDGAEARQRRPLSDYQAILDRNIFDARRQRAAAAPLQAAQPGERAAPFSVTVTGTLLAGDDSFAMAIGPGGGGERVYKIGECLPAQDGERTSKCAPGQAKLVRVEMGRIVVSRAGKQIPIEVTAGPASRPTARAVERSPRAGRIERGSSKALSAAERRRERLAGRKSSLGRTTGPPGSQATDEEDGEEEAEPQPAGNVFPMERDGNTYRVTVPNAEVEKAFENFSEVAGQAAAVPIIENGRPKGFQLRKIRAGSIFQRLGLKDNDLVLSVNGESLTTADQALRLFTVFRNEREIKLDIKRGNQDIHMDYSVE